MRWRRELETTQQRRHALAIVRARPACSFACLFTRSVLVSPASEPRPGNVAAHRRNYARRVRKLAVSCARKKNICHILWPSGKLCKVQRDRNGTQVKGVRARTSQQMESRTDAIVRSARTRHFAIPQFRGGRVVFISICYYRSANLSITVCPGGGDSKENAKTGTVSTVTRGVVIELDRFYKGSNSHKMLIA